MSAKNRFNRGDKVVDRNGVQGIILGSADFRGYDYNRPDPKWELVQFEGGHRAWIGNIWLKRVGISRVR